MVAKVVLLLPLLLRYSDLPSSPPQLKYSHPLLHFVVSISFFSFYKNTIETDLTPEAADFLFVSWP